jgi:cytoskeletal protein CcmA (bactofilin family)
MRSVFRFRIGIAIALLAALVLVVPAMAAEIAGGDTYRLEAGQVIEDDLVVSGSEIFIDGTVQGDVIATGGYIEVNGTIEGDLMSAGGEVRVNGTVNDDVRVGGGGVIIAGEIGDDLFAAAGGGQGAEFFTQIGERRIQQGVRIAPEATIGGSAYIGAGEAEIAGLIGEDLAVGAGLLTFSGTVQGDANVDVGAITVAEGAQVGGQVTYSAPEEGGVPAGVASSVRYEPTPPQPVDQGSGLVGQLIRLLLVLAGFALVGWLLLRFTPAVLDTPASAIAARPGQAGLYGLVATLLLFIIPIVSVVILIAIVLFWGWFPGLMFFLFLTAALVLAWTLSPLITGLWLGQAVLRATGRTASPILALLVGVALIVLLGFVPVIGWLVYLASFLLAVGGILLARRGAVDAPPATAAVPA